MTHQIINSHKSILFLNGTMPDKKILNVLNTKVPLIASDGAAKKMNKLGLSPDYVIGDLDSYKKQANITNIIKVTNQNLTDFEKCLLFINSKSLSPTLVLGANGGEIDHILGNMQIVIKHSSKTPMYFLDTYQNNDLEIGVKLGIPTTNNLKLTVNKGSYLSIIAFEEIILSTKGLEWELLNSTLHINGILGLRNKTVSNQLEISLKKGKALIILDIKL